MTYNEDMYPPGYGPEGFIGDAQLGPDPDEEPVMCEAVHELQAAPDDVILERWWESWLREAGSLFDEITGGWFAPRDED